jgi:uncharacterized membrane protein YkvA (DUF1232 family)
MTKRLFGESFSNWYRKLIRHSKYRWLVLLGTLLYLVGPIDISPDIFPVIGWIDDGLVATIAITEITQMLIDRKRRMQTVAEDTAPIDSNETVVDVEAAVLS